MIITSFIISNSSLGINDNIITDTPKLLVNLLGLW